MNAHRAVCNPNPAVYQALLHNNPVARPAASTDRLIDQARAIQIARAGDDTAPAFAKLVARKDIESYDRGLGENAIAQPDRMTWLVTVHADARTRGDPIHKPVVVHSYTMAIGAATGIIMDTCLGCDTVKG